LNRQTITRPVSLLRRRKEPLLDSPTVQPLSHRLTLLLHRVVTVMNAAAGPFFRERGISIPEARALVGLLETAPMRIGELAELTCIDFSTLSHMLRRLERRGLLRRGPDKTDYRSVVVKLTAKGKKIALECRDASLLHEKTLIGGLNKDRVESLKNVLILIYGNAVSGFTNESQQDKRNAGAGQTDTLAILRKR